MDRKCHVLTIIGYTLLAVFVLSTAKIPESHGHYQTFCEKKRCVKINVDSVLSRYPNLFVKKVYIRKQITSKNEIPVNSDQDICCPTRQIFESPTLLTNINGVERTVFQTNELQQTIPRGQCLTGGKCETCRILTRTMTILVVNFDPMSYPPVEFDQFDIPIYCACFHKQNTAVRYFKNFQETYMGTKDKTTK